MKSLQATTFITCVAVILTSSAFAQDHVLERLEESPRHHEWVEVKRGEGDDARTIHSFIVFPEVAEKATAVIVIHENRGLSDWVRGVADQLAAHGYIAIAPDLLSGHAPEGGRTKDFSSSDAAREALYQLNQDEITADLNAVSEYVLGLPACNGKLTVAGFCWGGGQTFEFASRRDGLKAAFVFYGSFPHTAEDLARIDCPVYGFYGGNDARINATIPQTEEMMEELGKTYEPVIYEGAGHGFMRSGEEPDLTETDANRKGREAGWARWLKILGEVSEDAK